MEVDDTPRHARDFRLVTVGASDGNASKPDQLKITVERTNGENEPTTDDY